MKLVLGQSQYKKKLHQRLGPLLPQGAKRPPLSANQSESLSTLNRPAAPPAAPLWPPFGSPLGVAQEASFVELVEAAAMEIALS